MLDSADRTGAEPDIGTVVAAGTTGPAVAVRHTFTQTIRLWADDWSEWARAGVETWRRAGAEALDAATDWLSETAAVARVRGLAWLAVRRRSVTIVGGACAVVLLAAGFAWFEVRTSWFEAHLLSRYARGLAFQVQPGPAPEMRFPTTGPYDERMGYTRLPSMVRGLTRRAFEITGQAGPTFEFSGVSRLILPPYHEKTAAGLTLLDRSQRTLYRARYPLQTYQSFEAIPDVVVRSLVFLENRELLESNGIFQNPAIEWDRFAAAGTNLAFGQLLGSEQRFGGSTLATQMEKFRHSPDGVTLSPRDKVQQMVSASVRSYLDGPVTLETRRRIVTDYVNSVPLGAAGGFGEVIGLADGLWAWYGLDRDRADSLLTRADKFELVGDDEARAYRSAVTLLVAQRRPAFYLAGPAGRTVVERETDVQIRMLGREGIISPTLANAALHVRADLRARAPEQVTATFVDRKAANAVRAQLLSMLAAPSLYALDRYDLTVRSTVDSAAQQAVTQRLTRMRDRDYIHAAGFDQPKLLGFNDPAAVTYSMILYERTPLANVVRVQADNLDVPFDLNQGARLELGSTAKIRTLVSYLEIIEELHHSLATAAPGAAGLPGDPLTRWAVEYHRMHAHHNLREMLDSAVERKYSANPAERFFTGGAAHQFNNFDPRYNNSVLTIRDAFANSVNLPFIRVMSDVVHYHIARLAGVTPGMFTDPNDTGRQKYLEQFADADSRVWLGRFHRQYRDVPRDRIVDSLVAAHRLSGLSVARVFRHLTPDGDAGQLAELLRARGQSVAAKTRDVDELFDRADPKSLSLGELGIVAGIHPLELWVADYLRAHPGASWNEVVKESAPARRATYAWLFDGSRVQGRALEIALETEAFRRIHASWRRMGYPYDELVPSLATAIGSSGDRPDALSELVGVLLDDGVRRPMISVDQVRFAEGTPYETSMRRVAEPVEWVLSPEVAAVARGALISVVNQGTAAALKGALRTPDDREIVIGGKTGTGENQFKVFGPGLTLVETRSVNRTATFVFFIGQRFFGTITASVNGPESGRYEFTSALPVKLFRLLLSDLQPLISATPEWSPIPQLAADAPVALPAAF